MGDAALYLETSAVLRALLEQGTSPEIERRILEAPVLVTSRLSQVEAARAMHRLRLDGRAGETVLADAERQLASLWRHCEIWELTRAICVLAARVAPSSALRTLDSLHLATFVLARRRIAGLEMLSVDRRLRAALERASD